MLFGIKQTHNLILSLFLSFLNYLLSYSLGVLLGIQSFFLLSLLYFNEAAVPSILHKSTKNY